MHILAVDEQGFCRMMGSGALTQGLFWCSYCFLPMEVAATPWLGYAGVAASGLFVWVTKHVAGVCESSPYYVISLEHRLLGSPPSLVCCVSPPQIITVLFLVSEVASFRLH